MELDFKDPSAARLLQFVSSRRGKQCLLYALAGALLWLLTSFLTIENSSVKLASAALTISLLGLVFSLWLLSWIVAHEEGSPSVRKVAAYIKEGSEGFLWTQYSTIGGIAAVFALGLVVVYSNRSEDRESPFSAFGGAVVEGVAFLYGATCSAAAGYLGMWVSVRTNSRVTNSAAFCYNEAFQLCFRGGAFAAVLNISLALFGLTTLFLGLTLVITVYGEENIRENVEAVPLAMVGFGFGASFVAMFAQLGGGIYTKAADVGADLIGKIDHGIPEDDPRNPAVIADLVGDNVGDCAGQSADLFESIVAEVLSAMILGGTLATRADLTETERACYVLFPLAVHSLDLVASSIAVMGTGTEPGPPDLAIGMEDPMDIMRRGYLWAILMAALGFPVLCWLFLSTDSAPSAWIHFSICGEVGIAVACVYIWLTRYYTDYKYSPVQSIAQAAVTGHATNIIRGLSVGLESTGPPVIVITVAVLAAYALGQSAGFVTFDGDKTGGLFGTAVATMGMFSTGVYVLSMSGFGPIADNAGGISEMSHQPDSLRQVTDRLDASGNVTKANAKGYSVGSAALASFLLFSAFTDEVSIYTGKKVIRVDISEPEVFLGGLLGAMVVFVFTGWCLEAVGTAAQAVVAEVRRQIAARPGILDNTEEPDYKRCVAIVAKAGLKGMVKPGLLAVSAPLIVGFSFKSIGRALGNPTLGAQSISAFIMFSTATGILMATFMNNAGGAWDNAKKLVETGQFGGKGSDTHKAAVTGDTVGDPCKDTAGPSIHILIKLVATVTLVLAPLFVDAHP